MNKNWKTALMALGIVPKGQPTMAFEVDDSNGKKLNFTDANDATEIMEGSNVDAEDGDYTFVIDTKTYVITVLSGKVTALEITESDAPVAGSNDLSTQTVELLQAFANEFEVKDAQILALQAEIKEIKSLMTHEPEPKEPKQTAIVGGKKINFDNINLK